MHKLVDDAKGFLAGGTPADSR